MAAAQQPDKRQHEEECIPEINLRDILVTILYSRVGRVGSNFRRRAFETRFVDCLDNDYSQHPVVIMIQGIENDFFQTCMEEIRDIIRGVENFRRCGSPSLHDEMEQLVDRLPVEGNMTWTKIIMIMAIFLELAETDYHHGDMDRIEALIRTAEQVFELAEITVWITNNGGWIAIQDRLPAEILGHPIIASSPLEIDELGTVPTNEPFIEAEEELMRQLAVASTSRLRRYIDKEVRRLAKRQDQFGAECRRREQEEIAARMAEGQPLAAAQGEEDAAEEEPMHAPEHQEEVPSQPIPPTTPRSSTRQSTNPRSFNTGDAAQALLNLAGEAPQPARTPSQDVRRATSSRNPVEEPQPTGQRVSVQPSSDESSFIRQPELPPMTPPGDRRKQYQQEIEKERRKKRMNENRQILDYLPSQISGVTGDLGESPELPPPRGRISTARAPSQAPSTLRPAPSTLRPVPSTLRSAPSTPRSAPSTLRPAPSTPRSAPSTLRSAPSALRPAPSTLRSDPSTLRPAPSTLRPAPSTLQPAPARSSTSQAKTTSPARPSTSQARYSTSQARPSTSQAQRTSPARPSTSQARPSTSPARPSTSQAQNNAPQPAADLSEKICFDIRLDDEDSDIAD